MGNGMSRGDSALLNGTTMGISGGALAMFLQKLKEMGQPAGGGQRPRGGLMSELSRIERASERMNKLPKELDGFDLLEREMNGKGIRIDWNPVKGVAAPAANEGRSLAKFLAKAKGPAKAAAITGLLGAGLGYLAGEDEP